MSKQQRCAHITRPASSCMRHNIAPMLPHVIFPRLQAVKLTIIIQYYTPLQGQDTIVYGKIAVPVPAPPPSGAANNHLGLVGVRGKIMRSTSWLVVYHAQGVLIKRGWLVDSFLRSSLCFLSNPSLLVSCLLLLLLASGSLLGEDGEILMATPSMPMRAV